jgi:hypothetical protein
MGVYLMSVCFMDTHLKGVHLIGVSLILCTADTSCNLGNDP